MYSDGTSFRVTANGLEKQPGIFISRLVPGGLAEGTGLLAVNDEVLEVNGIEVAGKSLDQVNTKLNRNCIVLISHDTKLCMLMLISKRTYLFNIFTHLIAILGDRHDGGKQCKTYNNGKTGKSTNIGRTPKRFILS